MMLRIFWKYSMNEWGTRSTHQWDYTLHKDFFAGTFTSYPPVYIIPSCFSTQIYPVIYFHSLLSSKYAQLYPPIPLLSSKYIPLYGRIDDNEHKYWGPPIPFFLQIYSVISSHPVLLQMHPPIPFMSSKYIPFYSPNVSMQLYPPSPFVL